jgi:integrase
MGVRVREKPPGSGNWYVYINHQGKRKAKRVGDRKAALEVARKIQAKLTLGDLRIEKLERQVPTFKEYSEKWLAHVGDMRKGTTYGRYENILRLHLNPKLASNRLDEITRGDLRDLLVEKSKARSRSTVELMRDVLSGVFNYAVDEEILETSPARGITRRLHMVRREAKITPLKQIEQAALLDACRTHFPTHYPFFLFMLRTGTRLGEALGIKWSDFDWENGFVWIKRTYRRGAYGPPKNGKIRRVKMSAQLRETMLGLLRNAKDTSEIVFGDKGKPWEQNDSPGIQEGSETSRTATDPAARPTAYLGHDQALPGSRPGGSEPRGWTP